MLFRHIRSDASYQAPATDDYDDGSLKLIVRCTLTGFKLFWSAFFLFPQAQLGLLTQYAPAAIALFATGLFLRWYAIVRLGRFFTVEVGIAPDHKLVDTGLFQFVRHPSYAGLLLMLLAIGVSSGNLASLILLVLPVALAVLRRIRIEEGALAEAFGEEYAAYASRTRRLVPFLY